MRSFFDTIRSAGFRRGPQRIFGGVCGGIAHKLGARVGIIRILVLIAFLLPFIGLGLYLALWALLPWQDGTIPLERLLSR